MTAVTAAAAAPAPPAAPAADPPEPLALLRDETRRLLGCEATDVAPGTCVADWPSIGRVVEATGDENPLYLDVGYGARSWWRTMVAPPAFVFAIRVPESRGALGARRYDVVDVLSRVELWWSDHVRLGDRVATDLRITGVGAGPVWRGRDTVEVTSRATYRSEGRPVATAAGTVRMHPRRSPGELFVERAVHAYTADDVARMEAGLAAEPAPRGACPRYHEDVAVGDELPTLCRGPFTWSELLTWIVAEGRPAPAGNMRHQALRDRPGDACAHPRTGWPATSLQEARDDMAGSAAAGFPAPPARPAFVVALAAQLVTTWMGDDAFLRHLAASLDAPVLYGDTLWLGGRVTDRFTQRVGGHEYLAVSVEVQGVNQLGQRALTAHAIVYLPGRGRPVHLPVDG